MNVFLYTSQFCFAPVRNTVSPKGALGFTERESEEMGRWESTNTATRFCVAHQFAESAALNATGILQVRPGLWDISCAFSLSFLSVFQWLLQKSHWIGVWGLLACWGIAGDSLGALFWLRLGHEALYSHGSQGLYLPFNDRRPVKSQRRWKSCLHKWQLPKHLLEKNGPSPWPCGEGSWAEVTHLSLSSSLRDIELHFRSLELTQLNLHLEIILLLEFLKSCPYSRRR